MRICKIIGHKWDNGLYKQYCKHKNCQAFRTLMENKYPNIGQPKYDWKTFDNKTLKINDKTFNNGRL